jgi:hypothetical protein
MILKYGGGERRNMGAARLLTAPSQFSRTDTIRKTPCSAYLHVTSVAATPSMLGRFEEKIRKGIKSGFLCEPALPSGHACCSSSHH